MSATNVAHQCKSPARNTEFDPKFKIPYSPNDSRLNTDTQRYVGCLDAEDCLLGYGIVMLGAREEERFPDFRLLGSESPLVRIQPWFEKPYSVGKVTSFWTDVLQEGREVHCHDLEFAVNIIVDPRSIKLKTIERDPWNRLIKEVLYRKNKGIDMILCDGVSRLWSAQRIAYDFRGLDNEDELGYFPWVARFYDWDKIHRHPREYEVKYYLCHPEY